jgi:hypothetical protein
LCLRHIPPDVLGPQRINPIADSRIKSYLPGLLNGKAEKRAGDHLLDHIQHCRHHIVIPMVGQSQVG